MIEWINNSEMKPLKVGVYQTKNVDTGHRFSSVWNGHKWVQIKLIQGELYHNNWPVITHWKPITSLLRFRDN